MSLKVKAGKQSLEKGYYVYLRLQAAFFYKAAELAWLSTDNSTALDLKK